MSSTSAPFQVCFVCLGNICRSPMADVVMRRAILDNGYGGRIESSSAGIGDWHIGHHADQRARAVLAQAGYDGEAHRARQITSASIADLDLVVALDASHERALTAMAQQAGSPARIGRLLALAQYGIDAPAPALDDSRYDVADPYYFDEHIFTDTLRIVAEATTTLFARITDRIDKGAHS